MSLDRIEVRGIDAYGRHGALPAEREREQRLEIDVVLELDLSAARASDDLADTLDYAQVHALVVRTVAERSYALLERLGAELLAELLRDPRVRGAEVRVAKPRLLGGATPGVVVAQRR